MSWTRCALELAALAAASLLATAASAQPAPAAADASPAAADASLTTAQPARPPQPLSGGVAALVNDDVISTYDLRQRALLFILTSGVQATQQNMPQIQQEALRSLIDEHLQLQELRSMEKKQKFEVVATDSEVDEALTSIASDNKTTVPQLSQQFASLGLDIQTLRDQVRVQISWQRMIQGLYGPRIHIGARQVNMALQRLKASADKPRYLISEIFIDAARAGGMSEATNGALQLIQQIQQGAPFGPVARQFSSAATAANGGDMGWLSSAELPRELVAAVEQMRPGQLSEPIQASDGVYVIQLRDKREGGGSTVVSLKQAAMRVPANSPQDQVDAARRTLDSVRASGATCADLESRVASFQGVVASDLGQSEVNELGPEFRASATDLPIGQLSEPIRTEVGMHLIMVCDRRQVQSQVPSKDEVENRLFGEQLAMLSRRYLRDLRNSATIEAP